MLDDVKRFVERLSGGGEIAPGHEGIRLVVADEGAPLRPRAVPGAR